MTIHSMDRGEFYAGADSLLRCSGCGTEKYSERYAMLEGYSVCLRCRESYLRDREQAEQAVNESWRARLARSGA